VFEQAVYAGRNHKTILAVVFALTISTPAQASDVARIPLDSRIESLVAGPDGGAWVGVRRQGGGGSAIGRAGPDGSFRTMPTRFAPREATVGPDGQAWFITARDRLARADTAGNVSFVGPVDVGEDSLGGGLATGPDGHLWTATSRARPGLARITPQGAVAAAPQRFPGCQETVGLNDVVRAADGHVWVSDGFCDRVARIAPDGTTSVVELADSPEVLAADGVGGVYYAASLRGFGGYVDAAGRVTRIASEESATDVAVAPDGGVWFALGRCAVARLNGGALELRRTTIPAQRLAFDPAGGLWLASFNRLVHAPVDALGDSRCDDRPPRVRVTPGAGGRVSLAALRPAGSLRVSVAVGASDAEGNADFDVVTLRVTA